MKLSELFETLHESFPLLAKHLDYDKILAYKKVNGKSYSVHLFRKEFMVDDLALTFEYTINPETNSWIFCVSSETTPAVEFGGGENLESAIKHLKKKHKISKTHIEKYFKG